MPFISYGILNWGHRCSALETCQKKAIRAIACAKYNAHTDPLFKRLKLLKIKDIYENNLLKFYHKYVNDKLPPIFKDLRFRAQEEIHDKNTRYKKDVSHPTGKLVSYDHSLKIKIPMVLNRTSILIRNKARFKSYFAYSRILKYSAIDKYETHCNLLHCYICGNQ